MNESVCEGIPGNTAKEQNIQIRAFASIWELYPSIISKISDSYAYLELCTGDLNACAFSGMPI